MEKMKQKFESEARKGNTMSLPEMVKFSRQKSLKLSRKKLKKLRYYFKATAIHSRWRRPPKFVTNSFPHYGAVFIDYADFMNPKKTITGDLRKRKNPHTGWHGFLTGKKTTFLNSLPLRFRNRR